MADGRAVKFEIALGAKVRDRVTGYEGVVTGRCENITGCLTYGVQPPTMSDGSLQDRKWFDEPRLDVIDGERVIGIQGCAPQEEAG